MHLGKGGAGKTGHVVETVYAAPASVRQWSLPGAGDGGDACRLAHAAVIEAVGHDDVERVGLHVLAHAPGVAIHLPCRDGDRGLVAQARKVMGVVVPHRVLEPGDVVVGESVCEAQCRGKVEALVGVDGDPAAGSLSKRTHPRHIFLDPVRMVDDQLEDAKALCRHGRTHTRQGLAVHGGKAARDVGGCIVRHAAQKVRHTPSERFAKKIPKGEVEARLRRPVHTVGDAALADEGHKARVDSLDARGFHTDDGRREMLFDGRRHRKGQEPRRHAHALQPAAAHTADDPCFRRAWRVDDRQCRGEPMNTDFDFFDLHQRCSPIPEPGHLARAASAGPGARP